MTHADRRALYAVVERYACVLPCQAWVLAGELRCHEGVRARLRNEGEVRNRVDKKMAGLSDSFNQYKHM